MSEWKQHPLSAAFPSMSEDEFDGLMADIQENGLKEAVTLYEGEVIDGWHRVQACQCVQVEIRTKELPADRDPISFVVSKNNHRRHLTASQRAAAVVRCHEWATPHDNQYSGSASEPESTTLPKDEKLATNGQNAIEPGSRALTTNEKMAHEAGVSARTITDAKTAEGAGLGDAVINGHMSAKAAAQEARVSDNNRRKPQGPTKLQIANERIEELQSRVNELEIDCQLLRDSEQHLLGLLSDEERAQFEILQAANDGLRSQNYEHMSKAEGLQREVGALRGGR